MRKKNIAICLIVMVIAVSACGKKEAKSDNLQDKIEDLQKQVEELKEEAEIEDTYINEDPEEDVVFSGDDQLAPLVDEGVSEIEEEEPQVEDYEANVFNGPDSNDIQFFDVPEGTTKIGNGAFCDCFILDTVTIPDSVKVIGMDAFFNCFALKEIKLPDGLVEIDKRAFTGTGLEEITIPENVEHIGEEAFINCQFTSIIIPDKTTVIDSYAFAGCHNVTNLKISSNVEVIGAGAFKQIGIYNDVPIDIVLPNTVKTIGSEAFSGAKNLTITLPPSVEEIGDNAFFDIVEVRVPQSLLDSLHIREDGFAEVYAEGFVNNNTKVTVF